MASVEVAAIEPYQGDSTVLRRALPGRDGIDRSRRALAQPRELVHALYRAKTSSRSALRSTRWFDWVERVEVPEMDHLARTWAACARQIRPFTPPT
ncbi:MAG: hypothetical protein M3O70_08255 [Actinomycetota bacterium]|nr:hypothetical protein [Actinomycetota bacterium]